MYCIGDKTIPWLTSTQIEVAPEKHLLRRCWAQPAGRTSTTSANAVLPKRNTRIFTTSRVSAASYQPYDTHDCRDVRYPIRLLATNTAHY
jgi:hypothetical protein